MHKFWYHSPVRFYKTKEELADYTNPQNNQYFGHKEPYPLEINEYHRFLIPEFNNTIADSNLKLWVNNGSTETQLPCVFGVSDGKLYTVTFACFEHIWGNFEIRNDAGNVLFYSNCVKFIDSTTTDGRKFIRIATKHTYNRFLFPFTENNHCWVITNLPAYCLGQFSVDTDAKNSRVGGNNTLKTSEAYLDEIVHYEFLAKGDANILSFIQTHVTNNFFYVDGTQRTAIDKLDADEFAMIGKLRLTNVKENGLNVSIDLDEILSDSFQTVLGNETKSLIYTFTNIDAIKT